MKKRIWSICLLIAIAGPSLALTPQSGDILVRVADTGAGLCCIVQMPDDHYMIYDAGNYTGYGEEAFEKVNEIIPDDSEIDLLVLSHSDADHLGAVDEICDAYTIHRIWRTGMQRSTKTWKYADDAIDLEVQQEDCQEIKLSESEFPPGATYRFGEVFVTMICGFGEPPAEWGGLSTSEKRNAVSIVVRLQYKGRSVLFCGDTVGRHIGDSSATCIAAEKFMVDNSPVIKIKSDVIIAPHHGADNGSSKKFIEKVDPEYVIFSAGHKHEHPRKDAAKRYTDHGVPLEKIFRTDLGDDEGGEEWKEGRINGHVDPTGDDDVDILLKKNKTIVVEYRNP